MLYAGATFFAILAIRYLWSVCRPGTLTIDRDGLTLNLGWRRLHWAWDEIDRAELVRTPGNLASAYMIYPRVGGRVRLFGWRTSTKDLQRQIERFLQT